MEMKQTEFRSGSAQPPLCEMDGELERNAVRRTSGSLNKARSRKRILVGGNTSFSRLSLRGGGGSKISKMRMTAERQEKSDNPATTPPQ